MAHKMSIFIFIITKPKLPRLMAAKNLHDKPFTEETITKLEIFEDYAEAWLPTFIIQGHTLVFKAIYPTNNLFRNNPHPIRFLFYGQTIIFNG